LEATEVKVHPTLYLRFGVGWRLGVREGLEVVGVSEGVEVVGVLDGARLVGGVGARVTPSVIHNMRSGRLHPVEPALNPTREDPYLANPEIEVQHIQSSDIEFGA
jgi:hypothetical protein